MAVDTSQLEFTAPDDEDTPHRPDKDQASAWLSQTLQQSKSYRSQLIKEIKRDVEVYQLGYKMDVPAKFHKVYSPTPKVVCDRAADRLGSGRLQVHMEARRPGKKEATHVEMLEKAGSSLFQMARKRVKYNTVRAMALHSFNRGAFVLKTQIDMGAFHDAPDRAKYKTTFAFEHAMKQWQYRQLEQFPILLDVRPIESVFPDPETDGDEWVIEWYRRKVGDVKKNYPRWEGWKNSPDRKDQQGGVTYDDSQDVEYEEVWTRTWHGVRVNGDWIPIGDFEAGPVPNLYGRPPYFIRYAGFGDPAGLPEQRCVSILRAIRSTAISESRLLSVLDSLAETAAYGALLAPTGDSGVKSFSFAPSALNEVDYPEKWKPIREANNLPDVLQALGIIKGINQQSAVPSEARGEQPAGRSGAPSGVAAAILTGQASMIIDPVKDAIEAAISDAIPFIFFVLDAVVKKKVQLSAQLGKDTFVNIDIDEQVIDGHYGPVFVELKLRAPEDDYAKWNLGIQAMAQGFPPEFVMEHFFGIENAEEMVKEMFKRQLVMSDPVRQYLVERVLAKLKAEETKTADSLPGEAVPAPGPVPPAGAAMMPPQDGMGGPPLDPQMRATMGLAPGVPQGPPVAGPAIA